METYCKNCKFYRRGGEARIDAKFVDGESIGSYRYVSLFGVGMQACQHSICFNTKVYKDIVNGKQIDKERIAGQAQLNENLDCEHYKRKWWKFWI